MPSESTTGKTSTFPARNPSPSPSSPTSKTPSQPSRNDAFASWMNIQNGHIIPKAQPKSQREWSLNDDSDLSDDEEFFETTSCGVRKLDPQLDAAVASFIAKRKARRPGDDAAAKQGEKCQSWWQRRKDEKVWRRGRKKDEDGLVY